MKIFLFCLPIISVVFMIIYFTVFVFLKEERMVKYKRIMATIICVSFVLQGVLVSDNRGINLICAGIWGIDAFFLIF